MSDTEKQSVGFERDAGFAAHVQALRSLVKGQF